MLLSTGVGVLYALRLEASGDWQTGLPWERALMLSIHHPAPVAIDWVMLGIPWLGTNLTLLPVIALVSLWLWRKRGRGELALQVVTVSLGSLIMNAVLKDAFGRPRPDLWEHRGQYAWSSYPSGHAIVCASVFFTIALMLFRERQWRWPFAAAVILMAIILYSRLYLGVHWPTDVVGGYLIGLVWLVSTEYAFAPFRHPSGIRPKPQSVSVQHPPPSRPGPRR